MTKPTKDDICCSCGVSLETDSLVYRAVVPLKVGAFLITQAIAWCDKCAHQKGMFIPELEIDCLQTKAKSC